jgi:hypothetical protein
VRQALKTLPWVEYDTIQADVTTHRVQFALKDKDKFDLGAIKNALKDVNFPEANLISGPGAEPAKK